MKFIADFHLHSKYSRATSKDMELENLDKWARIKGIKVLGTGDFTHPEWFKNLKEKLELAESGLFKLKNSSSKTRFILTVEVSCIYSKKNKVRRIHILIFAPSFEVVEKINAHLGWIGNLKADGRPILGLDAKELAKIVLNASENCLVVPAHCLLPGTIIHCKADLTRQIEDIKEGDLVYTHRNRWQKVTQIYKRPYKGKVYKIQPYYFREGLTTTPEHPFYVLKTQKHHRQRMSGFCHPGCSGKRHCCKKHLPTQENFTPQWILAQNLEKGDVLLYPRFRYIQNVEYINLQDFLSSPFLLSESVPGGNTSFNESLPFSSTQFSLESSGSVITMRGTRTKTFPSMISVSQSFCRLIGYFLAEGSVGRDLISFTFAKHEKEYLGDVRNLMMNIFSLEPSKERVKKGSIEIIYYSKILKEFFSSLCYQLNSEEHRAFTKALPLWMLTLPKEKQVEIVRGWWRGDLGYTSSRTLMNQMKIIFLRLGIIPSIYVDRVKSYESRGNHFIEGRKINAKHDIFIMNRLSFFEDRYHLLAEPEFQKFVSKTPIRHGWVDDDCIYLPIRDITIQNYKGEVYNLEVENDNSYISEFATVHNCWTPWFSVFGSRSGFDSLEECFDEYTKYIYAGETGLSSDPAMNWRLSALDKITLISNSDAHSLPKLGREANVFDTEVSYPAIADAIKKKDPSRFLYTIEFFPQEGKYHYDGHRLCQISLSPKESKKYNNICPNCGRPLTIGVLNRVEELADRPEGFTPKNAIPFKNLIPLEEIIAEALGTLPGTKQGQEEYKNLIEKFGSEFGVLLDTPLNNLENTTLPEIAEGILRVREGKVHIEPGYDGVFGKISIFTQDEEKILSRQKTLF